MADRLNMLFRDRRAHARTARLMETEARMSQEAWERSMDACNLAHTEVMSLHTTILGQQTEITELRAADRRRQAGITELRATDRKRQAHIGKVFALSTGLAIRLRILELIVRSLTFHVSRSVSLLLFQSLYAPLPSASTISYGPYSLYPTFFLLWHDSLIAYGRQKSRGWKCAHSTCDTSSTQFMFSLPNLAFILSPKLRFALSTCLLVCGCLTEANLCLIFKFLHQSLNGLSLNCFPLSDMISPDTAWVQRCIMQGPFVKLLLPRIQLEWSDHTIQPSQFSTFQLLEIERINKEERFKKKDMSIEEIMSKKRLIDDEINDITNDLSYKRFREPEDSLIMGDEHLDTIPEKESDELIKSSVENLVPIPSESEDFSDNKSECDVSECDETSPTFTTFSNHLFDLNDDFTSSDDKSLSDEDVPMENFKIYSNSLFDDEGIIIPKIDPHYFNAESNLIESLLDCNILIDSSPKFDYLLEEFSGELDSLFNLIHSELRKPTLI
ncbi:hypothetical protein Tco_0493753 [Tanacetum coccineum]